MSDVQAAEQAGSKAGSARNLGSDVTAALLLVAALLLPWNLTFGVGVPGSSAWLFALLIVVTVMSLVSLVIGAGRGTRSVSPATADPSRLRLILGVPYLLLVVGFVGYALIEAVRVGGTGNVPPGIGPGVLAGLVGALLAALPGRGTAGPPRRAITAIGIAAAVLTTLAVAANLYWRTRFPLEALTSGTYSGQNIAVIATTVVYAAVAWLAVLVALRWSLAANTSALLAIIGLGAATVLGATVVWLLDVGRDIDAFHGIAQTTSTAAVGFEGYLAWAAIAALAASCLIRTTSTVSPTVGDWQAAIRKCLALIAFWCIGSAVLRILDLVVAASLDMPYSTYDSIALMAFDIVAAAAALWIRFNVAGEALHPVVLAAGTAVLTVLVICRVVVGVGLAPASCTRRNPRGFGMRCSATCSRNRSPAPSMWCCVGSPWVWPRSR